MDTVPALVCGSAAFCELYHSKDMGTSQPAHEVAYNRALKSFVFELQGR